MNNISTINYAKMQNSEFIGLMLKILVFAESIAAEEVAASLAAFKTDVNALNKHLAENYGETPSKTAQRIHEERIAAYVALRYCVKSLMVSPDTLHAVAGAKYWNMVEKTEDPRRANQDAATRALDILLAGFREVDAKELAEMGADICVNALAERQADFIAAAKVRGQEADSRIERATRKLRRACYNSFRALAYHAVARATNNSDKECVEFVKQANGEIDMRRSQLKTRRTLAKKAAEEKDAAEKSSSAEKDTPIVEKEVSTEEKVVVEKETVAEKQPITETAEEVAA